MKYCNHCGAQLNPGNTAEIEKKEKRFDDYVDGLFWITVFGLGMILGGMVLIKQVLHLSRGLMIAYLIMSSTAFLTVFGICLWQIISIASEKKKATSKDLIQEKFDTNKLAGEKSQRSIGEGMSVTEETTQTFETTPKENVTN